MWFRIEALNNTRQRLLSQLDKSMEVPLSLDAGDSDLRKFLSYLATGIEAVGLRLISG